MLNQRAGADLHVRFHSLFMLKNNTLLKFMRSPRFQVFTLVSLLCCSDFLFSDAGQSAFCTFYWKQFPFTCIYTCKLLYLSTLEPPPDNCLVHLATMLLQPKIHVAVINKVQPKLKVCSTSIKFVSYAIQWNPW